MRNPANENRTVAIDLGKTGAPAGLTDAVCYTQYPYRRGVAVGLSAGSSVTLELAPWELLFLEIVPRPELKEPVVLDARWYRNGDTGMSIAADPGVESVRVIEPGREDRIIATKARPQDRPSGEIRSRKVTVLPEDKWLSAKPRTVALFPFRYPAEPTTVTLENLKESGWKDVKWKKVPSVEFELEATVTVPGSAASAQILLLVEYPGREHRPSRCTAQLAGRPLALEERRSDEHIGYYNWTGNLRAFESEWSWYLGNLPTGAHQIRFSGTAGHPSPRIGLWLWVDDERKEQLHIASVPCPDTALPPYRDRLEREGVCIMKPVALGA